MLLGRSCRPGTVCSRKGRTDSSTISGAIDKSIAGDGSNIAAVRVVNLLAFDSSYNVSGSAVNRVARNLEGSTILGV
jgi:hypothetical protein